ncbi:MAG: hypothetical protein EBX50_03830 [Chitinophagia bacterium]|nr:hypothetical protein [Chitinophagia bacterium]
MELDDLKKYWNQQIPVESAHPDPEAIRIIIHKRSVGIIERIRRSLLIEIIFCCLALVGIILGIYFTQPVLISRFLQFFLGITIFFMGILFWILRSSKSMSPDEISVKNNLIRIHTLVSRFTRSYFIFTMALFPPVIMYSMYVVAAENNYFTPAEVIQYFLQLPLFSIGLFVGYIVLSLLFLYFFTRWYIRTLYGNYLDKLKQLIAELDLPQE